MSATPRGCSACTNTGCYGPASGPRARSRPCGAICASASGCWMWAAAHIQHMQKALTEMNLQLHHVVADVTGVTGLRILRALVAGERDPDTLAAYSDPRCKAPAETLRAALVGNYREEHVFALAQALELYDIYQAKVAACDQRIEAVLERLKAANPPPAAARGREAVLGPLKAPTPPPAGARPPARPRRRQANEPGFAVREALHAILGADPTQIDGIGPSLALTLVGECGTDLSAWPSAKHFTSWLSLAPHNKISGGRVLSARTRRSGSPPRSTTKAPGAGGARPPPAAPAAGPRRCCGWRRWRLGAPRRPWGPSTAVWRRGWARPRRSPRRRARSAFSSTTCSATAWTTPIRAPPLTRHATGSGS